MTFDSLILRNVTSCADKMQRIEVEREVEIDVFIIGRVLYEELRERREEEGGEKKQKRVERKASSLSCYLLDCVEFDFDKRVVRGCRGCRRRRRQILELLTPYLHPIFYVELKRKSKKKVRKEKSKDVSGKYFAELQLERKVVRPFEITQTETM